MILIASLIALLTVAPKFHSEMPFTLGGSEVGKNVYTEMADGSFDSDSSLKVGAANIKSRVIGVWKNGTIESFTFTQSGQGPEIKMVVKDGKEHVSAGAETRDLPYKYKGNLFLASFHPQMMRNLSDAYHSDVGGSQKLKFYFFDAGIDMEFPVSPIAAHSGRRGAESETANGFEIDLSSIKIDFYVVGNRRVDAEEVKSQQFRCYDSDVVGLFADPIAAHPELSQATFKTKTLEGIKAPMRDGVNLVHDMMMPDAPGKYPVVLERTPYGRKSLMPFGGFYATRGYIYIVQDTRGREDSDGDWDPMVNERKDGYDTIEWIAKQPWCDGNVGMIGGSYGGYVQWAAAVEHPQALKCIVPQVSPPDAFLNLPYEYGTVPILADLWWLNIVRNKKTDMSGIGSLAPNPKGLLTLPLSKTAKATFGYDLPIFDKWLARDRMPKWNGYDIERDVLSVKIPVLHISGWWDGDGIGTELHWTKLRAAGKTNQWLIEGPWTHAFNTTSKLGEYDFGAGAIRDLDLVYLRWFDTWLKGKDAGLAKMAKATVFVTGENRWHETSDFPEPAARQTKWFLAGGGKLGSQAGTGFSTYTYDPHKADVPNLPKPFSTDVSLKLPVMKDGVDSLRFITEPFANDTAFEGSVTFNGFVRTDVVNTDLYVTLLDVGPDGTQMITVAAGKLNMAYRNGFEKPELMTPGKVYAVTVHPWWYAHRFAKGHRIAILVRSSIFPGTARNLNTGEPIANATRMVTAHVEILHDRAHPSSLSWYRLP